MVVSKQPSALVTEAKYLLLDEPFSGGLDPAGILALKEILIRLAKRDDVTIVMATPVPNLIEDLADRVAIIENGRIKTLATLDELRAESTNDGSISSVLESVMHPETATHLHDYFLSDDG